MVITQVHPVHSTIELMILICLIHALSVKHLFDTSKLLSVKQKPDSVDCIHNVV